LCLRFTSVNWPHQLVYLPEKSNYDLSPGYAWCSLSCAPFDAGRSRCEEEKDAKKQKTKGETSVSYGGAEKDGFVSGESDAEFLKRLTGSDTPQAQRIVTGKDPRYKDGAPKAEAPTMVCGFSRTQHSFASSC
jgi:hypothetical protein